ncbi:MAG: Transcriptional regulator, MarR family [candidate division CPR2 bacterium GW2011_GWC1_39_9]|uniref:Transcriptional regulator, MarR family n=1 Tax=candidate division CPR2 bacterium GW2011_GWC2_39_10 TaxID=1618345 RepID=A0A0G0PZH4_UNCC2|nr:MAG: Transcriptional regulator, MarR family [candidate division CPR2 bacterium GW2011_GWC2_39_10]KKR34581.1 MAG: Transcriptional regulator, MarR family [candidate division CPR2 bacterium GW2011_GWC1_39_9]
MDKKDKEILITIDKMQLFSPSTFLKLLEYFKSVRNIWNAPKQTLRQCGLIKEKEINIYFDQKKIIEPFGIVKTLSEKNINAVSLFDADYPEKLKNISDPPIVLYIRGALNFEPKIPAIGIVGSRKATLDGRIITKEIAATLARTGMVIVSGLAEGIDSEAHRGCLEARGKTIAVLGTPIDRIYPAHNLALASKILTTGGTIVSEYPPGIRTQRYHFVGRNRIIAALSDGVLLVEAAEKSGALITADFALDFGKDVYSVPGSPLSLNSKGTNNLIKMGAKPVTRAEDILEDYILPTNQTSKEQDLSDEERELLSALITPLGIEKLAMQLNQPISKISVLISCMELRGQIKNINGVIYPSK